MEGYFQNGLKVGTWKGYTRENKTLLYTEKFKENKFIRGTFHSLAFGKETVKEERMDKYDLDALKFKQVDRFVSKRTVRQNGISYYEPYVYPKNYKVIPEPESQIVFKISGTIDSTDNQIYTKEEVDSIAYMLGGENAISQHIHKNLIYPVDARRLGKQGRVIISFVVEKNGSLTDMRIKKGFYKSCDEHALGVMMISPPWHPAIKDGNLVRQYVEHPFVFKLN